MKIAPAALAAYSLEPLGVKTSEVMSSFDSSATCTMRNTPWENKMFVIEGT